MSNSNKIPRIELTRERSSTLESIQSLTRAIRESLRLHNIRREKKRRQKKAYKTDGNHLDVGDSKRVRSKSMDHAIENDCDSYNEISDVGISAVVASDIGANFQSLINTNATEVKPETDDVFDDTQASVERDLEQVERDRQRRHSKSVDEVELSHLRKAQQEKQQPTGETDGVVAENKRPNTKPQQMSLDIYDSGQQSNTGSRQPARQHSVPSGSGTRRQSKDDNDMNKMDANVLRKRFARLLETLRTHKFSISSLEENTLGPKSDAPN